MNSAHVRVFQSQDILCPDTEPLCVAASDGIFWTALSSGIIRGYSTHTTVGNSFNKLYEFKPIWSQVIDMHYLHDLKRLVTCERRIIKRSKLDDNTRSSTNNNNNNGVIGSTDTPMTHNNKTNNGFARSNTSTQTRSFFGGMKQFNNDHSTTSPKRGQQQFGNDNKNSSNNGVMEEVEEETVQQVCRIYHFLWSQKESRTKIGVCTLPVGNSVSLISTCAQSNAIQVCANRVISVWAFPMISTVPSTKSTAAAVTHLSNVSMAPICIVKLYTSWDIKCISIFKQFIGYGSDTDVRIVTLKYSQSSDLLHSNNNDNGSGATIENSSFDNAGLCTFWGVSQCSTDTQNFVEVRFNSTNYDLVPSPATSTYAPPATNHSRKNDKAYDVVGETPNVDHPAFVNKIYIETCTNLLHKHFTHTELARSIHFIRNIAQRKEFYSENAGMRCIISTSNKGYVYDISSPQLLSEFDYTGECIMSAVNSLFLFAITPAGMEVWSVLGSSKGCLLRFHPFIGLKSVIATNRKVVLLSKFSNKENVTIAAYYNQTTSEAVILSDIRNVEKLSSGGKSMGSLLPIFSSWRKQRRPDNKEESNQAIVEEKLTYSYNIYVLDVVELCEVHEDMLEKAFDAETEDPDKHFKMLKEAHSLLQSKYYDLLSEEQKTQNPVSCLQLKLELSNYTLLLKRSFGMLGDVYAKIGNGDQAASCYAHSDQQLCDVVKHLQSRPQSLIHYLESVLFDEAKCPIAQHNEEIGNEILNIYKRIAPHRLSTVILDSSLSCYSRKLAVTLLEQIGGDILNLPNPVKDLERILSGKVAMDNCSSLEQEEEENIPDEAFNLTPNSIQSSDINDESEDTRNEEDEELLAWWSDTRPKDAFALTLLLLETDEIDKAIKLLSSVDAQCIVDHCLSNPHLLLEGGGITPFGLIMRSHFPWCLLESLVRLCTTNAKVPTREMADESHQESNILDTFTAGCITVKDAFALLDSNSDTAINNRILLEKFLTAVLLTRSCSVQDQCELASKLLNCYIDDVKEYSAIIQVSADLKQACQIGPRSLTPLSELKEWCSFLSYSMLRYRHRWLNDLSLAELQEFVQGSAGSVQNTFDLVYQEIIQQLGDEIVNANYTSISSSNCLSRLVHAIFCAQALLCFIGSEDLSSVGSLAIIPVEPSKYFSSKDTDADDVFMGAKTLVSEQQFRLALSPFHLSFYENVVAQMGNVVSLNEEFVGKTSVILLGLSALRAYERAFDLLLKLKPQLSFVYANHYCKQLEEWKYLTNQLLELMKRAGEDGQLVEVYERIMWHLAKKFLPEDFLTLIPRDGCVDYFMPYINYCFSCSCSNSCYNAMIDIQQQKHNADN